MTQHEYSVVIGTTITVVAGSPEEAKAKAQDYFEWNLPETDTAIVLAGENVNWPNPDTAITTNGGK